MKHPASFISCLLIGLTLLFYRTVYSPAGGETKPLVVTQWDAFGYYLYLPAVFIYEDHKRLAWAPAIDAQYNVTGGSGMPVQPLQNGNQVCKYLCGVAILQAPLFLLAHAVSKVSGLPADGFAPAYQYALAYGAILYCFLALLLLRRILLGYFDDRTVAVCLLLICLGSNFVQYAAVHNGLSHAWIFPLYALLLYATIEWHRAPRARLAFVTGGLIGLATICRPTEAIALFIPLLWNLHTREAAKAKWRLVSTHRLHIGYAILGGLLGILPQLLYWKSVSGDFIYDVGSKWMFFDPWFRVLLGWEKGWFIYTPVTVFFVAGLFFTRHYAFRWAVLVFCLLNIWIVIAWEDWRYGATYSTRAMVQSYPVFALPLAAMIARVRTRVPRLGMYAIGAYLIGVNLFQTFQYNSTILHYDDMNRQYYSRIYLNPSPSPLDMSLLDTQDWIADEEGYKRSTFMLQKDTMRLHCLAGGTCSILDTLLPAIEAGTEQWLRVEADIQAPDRLWGSSLSAIVRCGDSIKRRDFRLDNVVGKRTGSYAFYMKVPQRSGPCRLSLATSVESDFEGRLSRLEITLLRRPLK